MSSRGRLVLDALEQWSGTIFLLAGGMVLTTAVINALDLITAIDTQQGVLLAIEGFTGFGGVVLSFVGLLSLYPRLAEPIPRLARTGFRLAFVPGTFFIAVFVVCSTLAAALGLPSLKLLIPSFPLATKTVLLLYAVALGLFGIGSFRTSVPSRMVGGLLLVLALVWFSLFGAIQVFTEGTPIWVTFVQTSIMAVSMGAIGYELRLAPESLSQADPAADLTV